MHTNTASLIIQPPSPRFAPHCTKGAQSGILAGFFFLAFLSSATATAADFSGSLKGVSITDAQATNKPPTATFTYTITDNTVAFDANSSSDPDGSITKYKWDFGNGITSEGPISTYTFTNTIKPQVTLTVIDDKGGVAINQNSINLFKCSPTPFLTQDSHDSGVGIGATDTTRYVGVVNTSTTPISLCGIDIYARENGNLSGKKLYVEIWNVNSSTNNLTTKQETILSLDASSLPNPIDYYNIPFGKVVSITKYQAIIFTLNETTGTTNYITIAYKSGTNPIPYQSFGNWGNTLSKQTVSPNNDMRAKFYGEQ